MILLYMDGTDERWSIRFAIVAFVIITKVGRVLSGILGQKRYDPITIYCARTIIFNCNTDDICGPWLHMIVVKHPTRLSISVNANLLGCHGLSRPIRP